MMCLNKFDFEGNEIKHGVLGSAGSGGTEYRLLDVTLRPCIPKQLTPYNKHLVDKDCIADYNDPASLKAKLKQSMDYLGSSGKAPYLIVY